MSGANANQRLSHMEAPRLRVSLLILSLLAALALPGAGAGSGTAAAGEAGSFGAKWERRVFGLTNPKMEKVLEALRAGRTGRAAGLARRLSASSREDRRLYGAILAARVALTQSRAEAADEHVASALETSETLAERSPALALELGRYQLARGRAHEALALFDRVRERHPGPARVSAAEAMSDAFMELRRFRKSREWIDHAVRTLSKERDSGGRPYRLALELMKAKQREVHAIAEIMQYGLGFVLYRKAQELRFGGEYRRAYRAYEKLIETAEANRENAGLLEEIEKTRPFDPSRLGELPLAAV